MDIVGGELWSGACDSWECDANDHLNVRFHIAKQMEALASLAHEIGMPRAFTAGAQATLVVRDHYIRFLREARPPDNLIITGGFTALGETDGTVLMVMRQVSGEIAAIVQMVVEHVTAREMRPFPWPARVRALAQAWSLPLPPEMEPRTLPFTPVESQANLARADELALKRGSLGTLDIADCDAFGRMRTEMFIAQFTRGLRRVGFGQITGMHARDGAGPRLGGAALEYRLIYLAWPRPGDRMLMRSGLSGADSRFRQITHWLLDPDTGRPWCVSQALLATFDMDSRKMITFTPEQQAAMAGNITPGLTL
jgi:acyl-CoA thioester hydrolase